MTTVALPHLSADLDELVKRATAAFERLTPSQQLRHRYMQRRSFARAFGGRDMPHHVTLTDAQIGLILANSGASR